MSLRKVSSDIANFLFIVYAFFVDMINVFPGYFRVSLWAVIIILQLVSYNFMIHYDKKIVSVSVLIFAFVFINNQEFVKSSFPFMMTLKFVVMLLYFFLMLHNQTTFNNILKSIIGIGFINVIATYFFFAFPDTYQIMADFWGYYPTGTINGTRGYCAALTNHYSHNGILCIITTMALFSVLMADSGIKRKRTSRSVRMNILFIISLFAVIMTTKRGVLLFGIIAMALVFIIFNIRSIARNGVRILLAVIVIVAVLYFSYRFVPIVHNTIDRFLVIGTEDDKEVGSRFVLWRAALRLFTGSPIFGIGWFGFRFYYNQNLFEQSGRAERFNYMSAHNVYIQILCETGIVGFIFYMILMISLTLLVFRLIRKISLSPGLPYSRQVIFGSCMHFMYLMYSFTGNCLYDMTFSFYCIGIGFLIGASMEYKKRSKRTVTVLPEKNKLSELEYRRRFFVDN